MSAILVHVLLLFPHDHVRLTAARMLENTEPSLKGAAMAYGDGRFDVAVSKILKKMIITEVLWLRTCQAQSKDQMPFRCRFGKCLQQLHTPRQPVCTYCLAHSSTTRLHYM